MQSFAAHHGGVFWLQKAAAHLTTGGGHLLYHLIFAGRIT
jgi:hypothetical protein